MPLQCPYCQIVQAKENKTCINCGKPLTPVPATAAASAAFLTATASLTATAPPAVEDPAAPPADPDNPLAADPVHAVQARRDSWHLPALIAVGLVIALVAAALWPHPHRPVRPAAPVASAATAPPPVQVPPVPLDPPVPSSPAPPDAEASAVGREPTVVAKPTGVEGPPAVRLASTSDGKHVRVGDTVLLTALSGGRNATLTLFYRRGRGPKTMLGFGQGSLWSGSWVPAAPGQYAFAATALDDRRQSAVSNRIAITVDAPGSPRLAHRLPPVSVAAMRPAVRPAAAVPPKPAARGVQPAPPQAYHVAAAFFYFSRSAAVLADALGRRGYRAVPERMSDSHGKTVYVVVTGTYHSSAEARKEVMALQRSGYQAYFFSSP